MNSNIVQFENDPTQAWLLAKGSANEAAIVSDLKKLPVSRVDVGDPTRLSEIGMLERNCHQNCQRVVEKQGYRNCRKVVGWWVVDGVYLLHSVIDLDGELFCVTPNVDRYEDFIHFIADDQIEERDDGEFSAFYRKGVRLSYGVRDDPAHVARSVTAWLLVQHSSVAQRL